MSLLFCTFVSKYETSSTTKPQVPEGHKIMKQENIEELVNMVKTIERKARLSALDEINDKLSKIGNFYRNVLDSNEAENIIYSTYGKRFEKMQRLRESLLTKERLINEIGGMIWEIKYNEIMNNK